MRKKLKITNVILSIFFLIFLATFIYSSYKIIAWLVDSKNTKTQIDNVQNNVVVTEISDKDKEEIIGENKKIPKSNPYWNYIKMNMMDVKFNKLKEINDEVVGWIKVNGTNINYPFVKHTDNDYYLNKSFDKSYNEAGWVFMDYRNNEKEFDKNTILYAHGRYDNTMFGTLKNVLNNNWIKDSNNYIIKISTENENTLWQVFSVYHIKTTSDYLKINFNKEDEYKEFLNMLIKRSAYDFNTSIDENDKILTLSTCFNNSEKMVMHAKLIKKMTK